MNKTPNATLKSTAVKALLGGIILSGFWASAGSMSWSMKPEGGSMVLTASINYADMVPQDLFGYWQRQRTIEQSSSREMAGREEQGAWVIYREGNRIMLRNPENNAETEVTVESVANGTAVFDYRKTLPNGNWCQETLSLSAADDALSGFQIKECYRRGQGEPYYYAFARVKGARKNSLPPIRSW